MFVSNWFENKISVVDIKKNAIKSQIPVGNSPAGIFLSKSGNLFVAIKEENLVSVIDISTQKKIKDINVGKAPYGVFSDNKTDLLFVTNVQSNTITIINKKSLEIKANIKVGSWPYQVAFEKKILFVTNQRDNSISIIDISKLKKLVKTLKEVCEYPEGIDISYNENLIVVACWFEDNIILLDLDNYKLIEKINVSGGPRAFGNFILDNYEK